MSRQPQHLGFNEAMGGVAGGGMGQRSNYYRNATMNRNDYRPAAVHQQKRLLWRSQQVVDGAAMNGSSTCVSKSPDTISQQSSVWSSDRMHAV